MTIAARRLGLPLLGFVLVASCLVLLNTAASSASDDLKPQRQALSQARQNYRQSVSQYGENSDQTRQARQNLRNARRSFHQQRRSLQGPSSSRASRRR